MILHNQTNKVTRNVKDYAGIGRDWTKEPVLAEDRFSQQTQRLIELANKHRWSVEDFDWQKINLISIPEDLRQSAADMFTQLLYGEVTALTGAAVLLNYHHSSTVQNFLRLQLAEESRHVEWFAHLLDKLDCQSQMTDSALELADSVLDCGSVEELVVGLHILVEGMAHSLFLEGARAFSKVNKMAMFLRPYRMAKKIVAEWLPEFLGKDESRHIAFGTQYLTYRVNELAPSKRSQLEKRIESWSGLYLKAAYDPDIWPVSGLNGTEIANRCADTINRRLKQIGFESRIPIKTEC